MKPEKILVVSPAPTHPQNAGNRARICQMLRCLRDYGCEIHFVLDDRESNSGHIEKKIDRKGMNKEWDKVYIIKNRYSGWRSYFANILNFAKWKIFVIPSKFIYWQLFIAPCKFFKWNIALKLYLFLKWKITLNPLNWLRWKLVWVYWNVIQPPMGFFYWYFARKLYVLIMWKLVLNPLNFMRWKFAWVYWKVIQPPFNLLYWYGARKLYLFVMWKLILNPLNSIRWKLVVNPFNALRWRVVGAYYKFVDSPLKFLWWKVARSVYYFVKWKLVVNPFNALRWRVVGAYYKFVDSPLKFLWWKVARSVYYFVKWKLVVNPFNALRWRVVGAYYKFVDSPLKFLWWKVARSVYYFVKWKLVVNPFNALRWRVVGAYYKFVDSPLKFLWWKVARSVYYFVKWKLVVNPFNVLRWRVVGAYYKFVDSPLKFLWWKGARSVYYFVKWKLVVNPFNALRWRVVGAYYKFVDSPLKFLWWKVARSVYYFVKWKLVVNPFNALRWRVVGAYYKFVDSPLKFLWWKVVRNVYCFVKWKLIVNPMNFVKSKFNMMVWRIVINPTRLQWFRLKLLAWKILLNPANSLRYRLVRVLWKAFLNPLNYLRHRLKGPAKKLVLKMKPLKDGLTWFIWKTFVNPVNFLKNTVLLPFVMIVCSPILLLNHKVKWDLWEPFKYGFQLKKSRLKSFYETIIPRRQGEWKRKIKWKILYPMLEEFNSSKTRAVFQTIGRKNFVGSGNDSWLITGLNKHKNKKIQAEPAFLNREMVLNDVEPISSNPEDEVIYSKNSDLLIDDWYNKKVSALIKKLHRKHRYDVVLVQYVYMTKAFKCFDSSVIKILDTHDKFTDRADRYSDLGIMENFFSTTAKEEAKALNRADTVIAIQPEEHKFFSSITNRKITTIGHLVPVRKSFLREMPLSNSLLYVGANNAGNIHCIKYFIKNVLPIVRQDIADIRFLVSGNVCNGFDSPECVKLGELPDVSEAYALADIVVNPIEVGTGLKIKSIEALGFGKPLVATGYSVTGLEKYAGRAFLVADTSREFAAAILKLLRDKDLFSSISHNAIECALEYRKANEMKMIETFFHEGVSSGFTVPDKTCGSKELAASTLSSTALLKQSENNESAGIQL